MTRGPGTAEAPWRSARRPALPFFALGPLLALCTGNIPSWVRRRAGAILGSFENGLREHGDMPSWDGTGDE